MTLQSNNNGYPFFEKKENACSRFEIYDILNEAIGVFQNGRKGLWDYGID